jgi:alpha-glucosidase
MWHRSGGLNPGRDGCRVPIPWTGGRPPYGFSPAEASRPWLDPPDDWAQLTVAAQSGDDTSMLALYRAGLRIRRATPELGEGDLRWIPSPDSVLAFARGEDFNCIVNFGPDPIELPAGAGVLISSSELDGGALPPDTTVWLRDLPDMNSGWITRSAPGSPPDAQEKEG